MLEHKTLLLRLAFAIAAGMIIAAEIWKSDSDGKLRQIGHCALSAIALGNIVFLAYVVVNHINYPFNLNTTEGSMLVELKRALDFEPIYPAPTSDYTPWAYNPGYFLASIPFAWMLESSLFTLRFVSTIAVTGCFLLVFLVALEKTQSTWWAIITIGLFAAAYRATGSVLDSARPDSLLLFSALLGTYVLDRCRSCRGRTLGIIVLCAAFWIKQHGALFAVGGVIFITRQVGLRRALPYWVAAATLGPGLYVFAGPAMFGSHFHYFTWEVPGGWTTFRLAALLRFFVHILCSYPLLAGFACYAIVYSLSQKQRLGVWYYQLVFAILTGLVAVLDPASSNHTFLPMCTWIILTGCLGIYYTIRRWPSTERLRLHLGALALSFSLLLYNPLSVLVKEEAHEAYDDLIGFLRSMQGSVYAPHIGYTEGYELYPTAHLVALADIARGPGSDSQKLALVRQILGPVTRPEGEAFVLTSYPLERFEPINYLTDYYVLELDLGERFKALRDLPGGRWWLLWPRYLYRFDPENASIQNRNKEIWKGSAG